VSQVAYNQVSVALFLARYRSVIIEAFRQCKNAEQCTHSTLFPLLLYDFLQCQTWVQVA
jgi:hypothetical protein